MTQDELCNGIDATMAAIVARSGDELLDSIAVSFLRNLRKECCDDVQLCIHCKLAPAQFCPVKGFYGCRTAAGVTGRPHQSNSQDTPIGGNGK